jgi:hypothetical protein
MKTNLAFVFCPSLDWMHPLVSAAPGGGPACRGSSWAPRSSPLGSARAPGWCAAASAALVWKDRRAAEGGPRCRAPRATAPRAAGLWWPPREQPSALNGPKGLLPGRKSWTIWRGALWHKCLKHNSLHSLPNARAAHITSGDGVSLCRSTFKRWSWSSTSCDAVKNLRTSLPLGCRRLLMCVCQVPPTSKNFACDWRIDSSTFVYISE